MTDAATELLAGLEHAGADFTPPAATPKYGPLRVHVVASSVVDAVRHAGGWMFDRARAGWAVTVFLADGEDIRPLDILGAEVRSLNGLSEASGRPHILAASSDMIGATPTHTGRDAVALALKRAAGRVLVWGGPLPSTLDRRLDPLQHHLTVAALAFKSQALRAVNPGVGVGVGAVDGVEDFRGRLSTPGSCDADLVGCR